MNVKIQNDVTPILSRLQAKVFPPITITSVATFGWAIRGQAGFGAVPGCVFAGTLIAFTWYFWSTRATSGGSARPYSSGWTLLAMIFGLGIEGMHGWSQYGTWIQGKFWVGGSIYYDINPAFGYAWLFVAAVPWGATGAVFLAWTRRGDHLSTRLWLIRLAFGGVGLLAAVLLFFTLRPVILPYWSVAPYDDLTAWEGCGDTYYQIMQAMLFMGVFLGFLAFEIYRKNWKNVKLIAIVAMITGLGWLVAKTWMFADEAFPSIPWNWWRCWEASGGFAIGLGYATAFFVCNKPQKGEPGLHVPSNSHRWQAMFERYVGLYMAIIVGMVYAVSGGIKGIFAIYDNEDLTIPYRAIAGVMFAVGLLLPILSHLLRDIHTNELIDPAIDHTTFGRIYPMLLSLLFIVGLLVTGPITSSSEQAFICFYVVLFAINASMIALSMVKVDLRPLPRSPERITP